MHGKLFFLCACLLAGGLGGYAWSTQRALLTARVVYLKILPRDPRALLAGDYMQLIFDFEREGGYKKQNIILYTDDRGIARVQQPGRPLTVKSSGLRYRLPHQFYFQEGFGKQYENAAYAKMAVLSDGAFVLLGLTNEDLNLL